MKKTIKLLSLLISGIMMLSSAVLTTHAADDKLYLEKVILEDEDFGTGFSLGETIYEKGTFYTASPEFVTYDAANEAISMVKTASDNAYLSYFFTDTGEEYYVQFDVTNNLEEDRACPIFVYNNTESKYRAVLAPTIPAGKTTTILIHCTLGAYVQAYYTTDGKTTPAYATGAVASAGSGEWNQIKLFHETGHKSADMLIDNFSMWTETPKAEGILMNMDFEDSTDPSYYSMSATTPNDSTLGITDGVLKMSAGDTKSTVTATVGNSYDSHQLPYNLPREYWLSFRAKMEGTAQLGLQFMTNGTRTGATVTNGYEAGARRVNLNMRNNCLVTYYGTNLTETTASTFVVDSANFALGSEWTTVLVKVTGDTFSVWSKKDSAEDFVSHATDLLLQNNGTGDQSGDIPNWFKFYGENMKNGSVYVDDIRVYTSGMKKLGEDLISGDTGISAAVAVVSGVGDTSEISGILALYDGDDKLVASKAVSTTAGEILKNKGNLTIDIESVPSDAEYAKLFTWDSLTSLQPIWTSVKFDSLTN